MTDGRVVKGVNFVNLRDAGDPVELQSLRRAGADELTFLDITAVTIATSSPTWSGAPPRLFMPLTVGGGVRTIEDIRALLTSGADKVSINTAAVARRTFVKEAAEKFGDQCIVVAIDAKKVSNPGEADRWDFNHGGRKPTGIDALAYAREVVALGAGEILLTSMDRDGTRRGFDIAPRAPSRTASRCRSSPRAASAISITWSRASATAMPTQPLPHRFSISASIRCTKRSSTWPAPACRCAA